MLDDDVKQIIQNSYRKYLQSLAAGALRAKLMIAQIARTLGGVSPPKMASVLALIMFVVEAGTGTGKTVAIYWPLFPWPKRAKRW